MEIREAEIKDRRVRGLRIVRNFCRGREYEFRIPNLKVFDLECGDLSVCPNCGSDLQPNAAFCRECGASDDCGWAEDSEDWSNENESDYSEEDDFDYDEFLSREFPAETSFANPHFVKRALWLILVLVLCGLILNWWW